MLSAQSGGSSSYKYRGVIPRAISHVFHHIEQHTEHAFTVRCSYLEIYNETFFDLLRYVVILIEQACAVCQM